MKMFDVFKNGNHFLKSFKSEKKAVDFAERWSLYGDYIELWSSGHLLRYWN